MRHNVGKNHKTDTVNSTRRQGNGLNGSAV